MHEKSAAIFTIHDAANMSNDGRKAIALWMREQAKLLVSDGHRFGSRFRARYMYVNQEDLA